MEVQNRGTSIRSLLAMVCASGLIDCNEEKMKCVPVVLFVRMAHGQDRDHRADPSDLCFHPELASREA